MSTNYYFISSPLHLLFSANLAIQNQSERNIAVLISKTPKQIEFFSQVLQQDQSIFSEILVLAQGDKKSKTRQRKSNLKVVKDFVKENLPQRIYTGTDRRVEFQYAMHQARKANPGVLGIYLDEGTATYAGHQRINSIQHKWVDPVLKKLAYGMWWDNPLIIGSSKWIDEVHAAFPSNVHSLLKGKIVKPIEQDNFSSDQFKTLASSLTSSFGFDYKRLYDIKVLVLMSLESFYDDVDSHLSALVEKVSEHIPIDKVAIKAHPRSKLVKKFEKDYPEVFFIDNKIGLEMLLPHLSRDIIYIGDISSTIFTIKWFNPTAKLVAVKLKQAGHSKAIEDVLTFYKNIGVSCVDYSELSLAIK